MPRQRTITIRPTDVRDTFVTPATYRPKTIKLPPPERVFNDVY